MRRSEVSTAPLDDAGSPAGPLGPFAYEGGRLTHEGSPISGIAERFGTPVYLYSAAGIRRSAGAFREAFARFTPEIHFAAKACGNVRILSLLVGAGLGIDAVSGG